MARSAPAQSGIIRVEKDRSHPYKTINTAFANDERLSWGARGVLVYLLSKPDDWKMLVKDLIKQSPAGRDAVYAILQNLEACGYLKRIRTRRDDGTFEYSTVIYEKAEPLPAFPEAVFPEAVYPEAVQPYTEKPEVYRVGNEPTKDRQTKERRRPCAAVDSLALSVDVAMKEIGIRADQRRTIIREQPGLTLERIAECRAFLAAPPNWCQTPVGYVVKALRTGDAIERTNGHQRGVPAQPYHQPTTLAEIEASAAKNDRLFEDDL